MSGFCKKLVSINSLPELILFTISLRVLVFSALRLFNHSSFLVYNFFSNSPGNQLVTQPDRVRKQDARLVKIAQPFYKFFPGKFCFSLRGTTMKKRASNYWTRAPGDMTLWGMSKAAHWGGFWDKRRKNGMVGIPQRIAYWTLSMEHFLTLDLEPMFNVQYSIFNAQ